MNNLTERWSSITIRDDWAKNFRYNIHIFFPVIVVFFLYCQTSWANSEPHDSSPSVTQPASKEISSLKIAYIEFPPATFSNDKEEPDGYVMNIMKTVVKEAGYHYTARPYPANRLIHNMIAGEADFFVGVSSLIQLTEHIIIGKETITNIYFRSYFLDDFGPILRKQDLLGKRVIIMRGYSYNGWANYIKSPQNNIQYFEADSHSQGLDALQNGRGDILLDYQGPATIALEEAGLSNIKKGNAFNQPLYFVVSKKAPHAQQLVNTLDATYRRLKKEGRFSQTAIPIH